MATTKKTKERQKQLGLFYNQNKTPLTKLSANDLKNKWQPALKMDLK